MSNKEIRINGEYKINSPTNSKINIAAALVAVANYLALRGYISEDLQALVMELAGILGPVLIIIFRSFFTVKKIEGDSK